MRIVVPKAITASNLVSYNVPEDDYDAYDAATVYLIGSVIMSNHRVYIALKGDSTTNVAEWLISSQYMKNQRVYSAATKKIYKALAGVVSASYPEWDTNLFYTPGTIVKHTSLKKVYQCARGENPNNYAEWASGTTYTSGTYVKVTSEKKIYKALKSDNTGKIPSSNLTGIDPYWSLVGVINQGTPPDISVLHTEWDSATGYTVGMVVKVTNAESTFKCLVDNTNKYPVDNMLGSSPYWQQLETFTVNQTTTDDFKSIWDEYGMINEGYDPTLTANSDYWEEDGEVNVGYAPIDNVYGDDPFWTDAGPTNAWSMFDDSISYLTKGVVIEEGRPQTKIEFSVQTTTSLDCISLFNVTANKVTYTLRVGSDIVWTETDNLIVNTNLSWSEYFFSERFATVKTIFKMFPRFAGAVLTVSIQANSTAMCGLCVLGKAKYIGMTLQGLTNSIADYSKKSTSEAGVTSLSVGSYAKDISATVDIDNDKVDAVYEWVASVRAQPLVFISDNSSSDEIQYQSLMVYGFYSDFSLTIPGPTVTSCTFEIKGLT